MQQQRLRIRLVLVILALCAARVRGEDLTSAIEAALGRAGDNADEIISALETTPKAQQEGMRFLVAHMPDRDLQSLNAEFLLENTRLAYLAWEQAPWRERLPKEIFLNNVLPYASINERRDNWRQDFYARCKPLVKDAKSAGQAAAILNQKIFPLLKVRYSTKRNKADQSPYESIESGTASCTGLSVLLIDACRSVGVPARFVGTPLWSNKSGNHSWVEIWDEGWHFTGAAEATGEELDRAWFANRAATAQRDDPLHAIFAVSYKRTPQTFPLVWDPSIRYIHPVNVTDRYTQRFKELPAGMTRVMFRVLTQPGGDRLAAEVSIKDKAGKVVFEGQTKDERFDANDHLTALLSRGQNLEIDTRYANRGLSTSIEVTDTEQLVTLYSTNFKESPDPATSLTSLETHLAIEVEKRPPLSKQPFAQQPLTRDQADAAGLMLWNDRVDQIRQTRAAEMEARKIRQGDLEMPFYYRVFGEKPAGGRSLYISLHGGGGAPKQVNDQQWENQKRLYRLEEGVYLVPRAPTNTWNLWHQQHIDGMFERLIENLTVFEDVDPNRVYLMGFSAGGDGVFQLAPRMADRLAAAAMMSGHPNETSPLGLRNLPFTLHVGGRDAAYNRNQVAGQWKEKLAALHAADPDGYEHWAKIYPDKGHWLDREDAAAIPWMAKHRRQPLPKRVVWKQDDVTHARFYWLAVNEENRRARSEVIATLSGQTCDVQAAGVDQLTVRLNDNMLDLDQPVEVTSNGQQLYVGRVTRTIAMIAKSLDERGDPQAIFSGELTVAIRDANQ